MNVQISPVRYVNENQPITVVPCDGSAKHGYNPKIKPPHPCITPMGGHKVHSGCIKPCPTPCPPKPQGCAYECGSVEAFEYDLQENFVDVMLNKEFINPMVQATPVSETSTKCLAVRAKDETSFRVAVEQKCHQTSLVFPVSVGPEREPMYPRDELAPLYPYGMDDRKLPPMFANKEDFPTVPYSTSAFPDHSGFAFISGCRRTYCCQEESYLRIMKATPCGSCGEPCNPCADQWPCHIKFCFEEITALPVDPIDPCCCCTGPTGCTGCTGCTGATGCPEELCGVWGFISTCCGDTVAVPLTLISSDCNPPIVIATMGEAPNGFKWEDVMGTEAFGYQWGPWVGLCNKKTIAFSSFSTAIDSDPITKPDDFRVHVGCHNDFWSWDTVATGVMPQGGLHCTCLNDGCNQYSLVIFVDRVSRKLVTAYSSFNTSCACCPDGWSRGNLVSECIMPVYIDPQTPNDYLSSVMYGASAVLKLSDEKLLVAVTRGADPKSLKSMNCKSGRSPAPCYRIELYEITVSPCCKPMARCVGVVYQNYYLVVSKIELGLMDGLPVVMFVEDYPERAIKYTRAKGVVNASCGLDHYIFGCPITLYSEDFVLKSQQTGTCANDPKALPYTMFMAGAPGSTQMIPWSKMYEQGFYMPYFSWVVTEFLGGNMTFATRNMYVLSVVNSTFMPTWIGINTASLWLSSSPYTDEKLVSRIIYYDSFSRWLSVLSPTCQRFNIDYCVCDALLQ